MRSLRALARRIVPRPLRRRLRDVARSRRLAWPRRLTILATDLRLFRRQPRTALPLLAADLVAPDDIARLGALERLPLRGVPRSVVRRRADLLNRAGEPSAALDAWRELARRGYPGAGRRVRNLEGRLRETDTSWIPAIPGGRDALPPASRKRVLHLLKSAAPARWSGFTIRTLQNLRAQRQAGLEPIVVTKLGWPREVGVTDVPEHVVFDGFEHYQLDRGPAYDPTKLPADVALEDNAEAMAEVVRRVRPAILHVHSGHRGGELALVALALRERFGIPVVYEVRGLFEANWTADRRVAERAEMYRRRLAQETRILREVDGVLAISEALADELAGRGISRSRITIIPNGIDPAALGQAERDPDLRARLGLAGRATVGYVGNLDHWREGLDVLIGAIAELHRRGRRDVAAIIVGDGVRRAELEAEARRRRVAGSVVFTGRVPHEMIGSYYAQLDVFTNPRLDERAARLITPLKPYEAMALGIPVLVSDLPALREIVDPPNRGEVAPPGDPVALADAIDRLLDDPDRRRDLGEIGRAWVRGERTWAANGPRYRAAYEAILGPLD